MPRPRRSALLLVGALLLTACTGPATSGADPSPSPAASATAPPSPAAPAPLAFTDCGQGFDCASLPVPVDAADPALGTVELAVVRRAASGDRIGVLAVNPGGPGAGAVAYLRAAYEGLPERVRSRFDVVAFDPRGVGDSAPVRCAGTAELDAYFALDPSPDDAAERTAYVQGQRELAQGCAENGPLLAHLSTAEAAADLDRLRAALGEEQLDYLGYSYGTAIGARYLEDFPGRTRTMVLDGALDPALSWDALLEGQSSGFDDALTAFVADCAAQRCAFARAVGGRPDAAALLAAYDRLRAEVDRTPLPGPREVGPGEFDIGVLSGLYSEEYGWPVLADSLAAALRERDGTGLLALSDAYLERGDDGYSNVTEANLAVVCTDRPWPRTAEPYFALAERVAARSPRFGPAIALSGLACASWPVPPTGEPDPVQAPDSPPVLVIGTTGDPATPYAWSQALAAQLPRGVLLTHVGDGHTVYRSDAPDCVLEVVDTYLLTEQPPAPTRC